MSGNVVSDQAAHATRVSIGTMAERVMRFQEEHGSLLTDEEKRVLALDVVAPMSAAVGAAGTANTPMTDTAWRFAWTKLGEAARGWEALGAMVSSPTRAIAAPVALALRELGAGWTAAMEHAPRALFAASGGLVIAAVVGVVALVKVFGNND